MARTDADLITEIAPYTKSSIMRRHAMIEALRLIDRDRIAGDIVECGVWRGGNIMLARKLCPDRVCWLYDTFTGMTRPQAIDVTASGKKAIDSYAYKMQAGRKWAGVSTEEVEQTLRDMNVFDEDKCLFVEGPVEKTLREPDNLPSQIALLRLDTDWYASTKIELEVLYPLLQVGGVLIIDDYGHWRGAKVAVDDYFAQSRPQFRQIDYTAIMTVKTC